MKFKLMCKVSLNYEEYTIVRIYGGTTDRTMTKQSLKECHNMFITGRITRDMYPIEREQYNMFKVMFEFSNIEEFENKFIEYLI